MMDLQLFREEFDRHCGKLVAFDHATQYEPDRIEVVFMVPSIQKMGYVCVKCDEGELDAGRSAGTGAAEWAEIKIRKAT